MDDNESKPSQSNLNVIIIYVSSSLSGFGLGWVGLSAVFICIKSHKVKVFWLVGHWLVSGSTDPTLYYVKNINYTNNIKKI